MKLDELRLLSSQEITIELDFDKVMSLLAQVIESYLKYLTLYLFRGPLHSRKRQKFCLTTSLLTANEFRLSFRMDQVTFLHLIDSIRFELTWDEQMGALQNRWTGSSFNNRTSSIFWGVFECFKKLYLQHLLHSFWCTAQIAKARWFSTVINSVYETFGGIFKV